MSTYYPIFIQMSGKNCVVVGGGEVAERKVSALLEHGASVTVISSFICKELANLAEKGKIKILNRDYQFGDLEDTYIAIAASDDPDVNLAIAKEGKNRGILINVVDNPEYSDFIVPSLLRRGDISIAVSTAGKSPALSRKIRTHLEDIFVPEYKSLLFLVAEVRQELLKKDMHVDADIWQEVLELDSYVNMIKEGKYNQAKEQLMSDLQSKSGI